MGTLYYGDNLHILRNYIADKSVDLIYLDPPFNSKADYNVLFKESSGERSDSQIRAFSDFWKWDQESAQTFDDIIMGSQASSPVKEAMTAMVKLLGHNDMSAYLVMMAIRLLEMKRVLKPTGSIYLHCDPTASHYLKIMMDQIFGGENFRNEIVWKRSHPKGLAFTRFASDHDIILYYGKDKTKIKWNPQYLPYDKDAILEQYNLTDADGRRYQLTSLLNPNPDRPNLTYEFKGVTRVWRWTKERMLEEEARGRIVVPESGKIPRYKRYLDEQEGLPIDDIWNDIGFVQGAERLGYQTQKPLALLERIISASSNEGDLVLDPFCGCGTAIHAAQKLGRDWVGIDVTHLAINLIRNRLRDAFGIIPEVIGEPTDLEGARQLANQDRFQFQWWALSLIGASPLGDERKKGSDRGIDGIIYNPVKGSRKIYRGYVQVKSGHVGSADVRDFRGTLERDMVEYGIFITLEDPTEPMNREALEAGFFATEWDERIPRIQIITIRDLLNEKRPKYPFPANNYLRARKEEKRTVNGINKRLDRFNTGD